MLIVFYYVALFSNIASSCFKGVDNLDLASREERERERDREGVERGS